MFLIQLTGSSSSTVKGGGPRHVSVPTALSLPHSHTHLHLDGTATVLCPGTLPEKVALDEPPPHSAGRHRAATSPRSPALSPVTHSAPGDRYNILYHSLCTSSRCTCTRTCTHARQRWGEGRRQKEWLNTKTGPGQTIIPSRLSAYLTPPPPSLTNTAIP